MTDEQKSIISKLLDLAEEDVLSEWETDFVIDISENWMEETLTVKQNKVLYRLEAEHLL